jgi:ketosteroid isomerase-like protein
VSEQNVELHRRWFEAYNARDIEALIAYCDPGIEFHSVFAAVGGALYHGHDGMRRWHRDMQDVWGEKISIEPEAYFDLGDDTLVFALLHGRGQGSGAEVAIAGAQVARWRDGRMVYVKAYANKDDALGDLGISEDALEPIAP